jgi:hypothetical protein
MLKKLILPSLLLLCLSSHLVQADDEAMQKCQMKHPEWYQCVTAEDCTIALDPCGWPVLGVNKLHKDRAEICSRQAGAFLDCAMWNDIPENKRTVDCQENLCVTVKPYSTAQ